MNPVRTILLYGNSLIVSSIGASLENRSGWRIVRTKAVRPDGLPQLGSHAPDVLIFDLTSTGPELAIALLKEYPTLLVLGVDLASGRMLVFSGQQSDTLTTDDLINVIERHSGFQTRAVKRGGVIPREKAKGRIASKLEKRLASFTFIEETMQMKAFFGKWAGLNQRAKVLTGVASVVVLLLLVGGGAMLMAGDQVNEVASSMFGADYKTIHFYPDPACVGVGDKIYVDMFGWGWNAANWESGDSSIAQASGQGEITGKKVGTTEMKLKGKTGVVTMKSLPVTVKKDMAECTATYMSGANTTPPEYEKGATSFKFVFVSDTQGCPGCSAADGPDLVDHDFAQWFGDRMINNENPAFIVSGGDVSGLGGLGKQYGKQWLDDIAVAWKNGKVPAGKTAIPIYAVVGNHDLTRVVLGESWKSKQEDWQGALWNYYFDNGGKKWPTNVSDSYKNLVYSFRYGNSIFIFTDDYYMWGNSGNDNDWLGNMIVQEVNPAQVAFVASQLNWAKSQSLAHAFAFGHVPLVDDPKDNNQLLVNVLNKSNLSGAYLGGHTRGLEHKTIASPFEQFIAETGGGDKNPNSYLRVEVNGSGWTVTTVFRDHSGKVWEGTVADKTKWVYTK